MRIFKDIYALKENIGFKKYFKNTTWLFVEKIFRLILVLSVSIWLARYLGPEQFGVLSYAISFVGLFAAFSTLGLDSIVIRELVKNEEKRDSLLGTAFLLKLVGAFIVLFIIFIIVRLTSSNEFENTLIIIIAGAMIFQSINVIDFYFQSKVLSKYVVYANIITLSISSIIKVALIINEAPLISFAIIVVFDSFILACGYIYFYYHEHLSFRTWKFTKSEAKSLLKDSWPLIMSGLAIAIYMKIDQVMIKEMLDSEAVGQYSAAVKLSEAWYFIPMVIASSLFPAIINSKKQSADLYNVRLQKLYDLMVWMAVAIAVPMTFMSGWVIELLYGGQYDEAGSVLMIHIWAAIFVFLGVASTKWLIIENLQSYLMINTAIGAVANILLNFLLINRFGIEGAAWASLISYFIAAYLCLSFYKATRINFYKMSKSLMLIRIFYVKKTD